MAEETTGAITQNQENVEGAAAAETQQAATAPVDAGSSATTPSTGETVEAKIARLEAEAKQARDLQAQADRRARKERAARIRAERKGGEVPTDDGEPTVTAAPSDMNQEVERTKAEANIARLAYSNPKYREVLDSDPTLKRIVDTNPLALVKDPLDAEDAVFQVEDFLNERLAARAPAAPVPAPKAAPTTPDVKTEPSSAGAVNPNAAPNTPAHGQLLAKGDINGAIIAKLQDPTQVRHY